MAIIVQDIWVAKPWAVGIRPPKIMIFGPGNPYISASMVEIATKICPKVDLSVFYLCAKFDVHAPHGFADTRLSPP
jgi:hypothetical protein